MAFSYKQIGQARPANTSFATLGTLATTGHKWVNGQVVVCNTTAGAIACRVCHDNDGTTYDESTALAWDKSVPANDTITLDIRILGDTINGSIGVRTATANALTFTLYAGLETP